MKTRTKEISFYIEDEVLVAHIELSTLLDEFLIHDIGEQIEAELREVDVVGLLIDCSELTSHVSSQFLGMLVGAQKKARAQGLTAGVCGLTNFLRTGFELTSLAKVVPAFTSRKIGVDRLRQRDDIWAASLTVQPSESSGHWLLGLLESTTAAYVTLAMSLLVGLGALAFWAGRWSSF